MKLFMCCIVIVHLKKRVTRRREGERDKPALLTRKGNLILRGRKREEEEGRGPRP